MILQKQYDHETRIQNHLPQKAPFINGYVTHSAGGNSWVFHVSAHIWGRNSSSAFSDPPF